MLIHQEKGIKISVVGIIGARRFGRAWVWMRYKAEQKRVKGTS